MLNLITKATVTTIATLTLVGSLSVQAHAQSAMPIIAAASVQTQQIGFINNAALKNIRLNRAQLQSRRSVNPGLNLGGLSNRSSNVGPNRFGQSSINDGKFGQSDFNRNKFGQSNFDRSKLGQNRFSNDSFSNRSLKNRQFSPQARFSSHINSEQNFKTAKVLTSRF